MAIESRPDRPSTVSDGGFEAAFSSLFNERFRRLFGYLARITGDGDLASDLAQGAFVQLYQRGSLPNDPGAWLLTVANNRLRDHQRTGRRRLTLLSHRRTDVPVPSPWQDAEAQVQRQERRAQVRLALEDVSPRDRELLLMHHAGYSYREIATALGVANGSVGTLLRRAGVAFRGAFERRFDASV